MIALLIWRFGRIEEKWSSGMRRAELANSSD